MTTLNQDGGRIGISDGDFILDGGIKSYGNILEDAVRTLRGELQLDTEDGIPYDTTIWATQANIPLWKHYVSEKILSYAFVLGIASFVATIEDGNKLTYEIVVNTDLGEVTLAQ